ncbi:MAG: glycerophosphodiester phosphodiesterase [Candidatus Omnitrophica bacterium]|nr:glycerophosphodiester phosphodiesterase [Candidatus Omnitrophota bacterium]
MPWNFGGDRLLVIAHRGASREAPENTAAAIRLAFRRCADMVELDVQLTRDGRVVIFHDDRLERTSTGCGRLMRLRYRELRRLDTGSWWSPRFRGERILLASEALRMCPPSGGVNLELKRTSRPQVLIRGIVRCVRRRGMQRRVLLSSFDGALLARLKAAAPGTVRALLCARRPWAALRRAVALECVALHPHHAITTRALVQRAHAQGVRVHVWTVDRLAEARRLLRMGVDGLVTNIPGRMHALHGVDVS